MRTEMRPQVQTRPDVRECAGSLSNSDSPSILAIDPGSAESGWVVYVGGRVTRCGIDANDRIFDVMRFTDANLLAIEMMKARGMPVSNDEMETLVWIGRFKQAWCAPDAVRLVYRFDVKLHVCGNVRANDTNIRAALLDRVGPQGTKKAPGPTYGVRSHVWPALGVAVTVSDSLAQRTLSPWGAAPKPLLAGGLPASRPAGITPVDTQASIFAA